MIDTHGRRVVEVADAGEIFLDKPTAILVTGYPVRREIDGGSHEPPFHPCDEFLSEIQK